MDRRIYVLNSRIILKYLLLCVYAKLAHKNAHEHISYQIRSRVRSESSIPYNSSERAQILKSQPMSHSPRIVDKTKLTQA